MTNLHHLILSPLTGSPLARNSIVFVHRIILPHAVRCFTAPSSSLVFRSILTNVISVARLANDPKRATHPATVSADWNKRRNRGVRAHLDLSLGEKGESWRNPQFLGISSIASSSGPFVPPDIGQRARARHGDEPSVHYGSLVAALVIDAMNGFPPLQH